jgi:hypothetical protein
MREDTTPVPNNCGDGRYRNKQRCLVLHCSRGVTARYRHLLGKICVLSYPQENQSSMPTTVWASVNICAEMQAVMQFSLFLGASAKIATCGLAVLVVRRGDRQVSRFQRPHHGRASIDGKLYEGSRPLLTFQTINLVI